MNPELDKPADYQKQNLAIEREGPDWAVPEKSDVFDDETVLEKDGCSLTQEDTVELPPIMHPAVSRPAWLKLPKFMQRFPDHIHGMANAILESDAESNIRSDQRCRPSLISTFQDRFATLVVQEIKRCNLFDITEETQPEKARDLGIVVATLLRQWRRNRLTLEEFIALLRIHRDRIGEFVQIIESPRLPAEALIPVERLFRTEFLPGLQENLHGYISPETPSEDVSRLGAIMMTAYYADTDHAHDLLKWVSRHPDNFSPLTKNPSFQNRLRLILDDARTIADDDVELHQQIDQWPCPTEDAEPFLRYFAHLFNERHFTWFIAFEANHEKMYIAD